MNDNIMEDTFLDKEILNFDWKICQGEQLNFHILNGFIVYKAWTVLSQFYHYMYNFTTLVDIAIHSLNKSQTFRPMWR